MKQRSPSSHKPSNKPGFKAGNKAFGRNDGRKGTDPKPGGSRLTIHLFGQHAVREAWLNPKRSIQALYVTENALKGFEGILGQSGGLKRPSPTIVEKDAFDKALPPGTVHQGIALNCAPLPEVGLQDLMIRVREKDRALFMILDQVTDPHNIGAILRSACAFGADGIIVQKRHAPELQGPAGAILAKTACGALEHTPVAYETNLSRSIETLQEEGYFVFGLDERGTDMPGRGEFPAKCVLVLGAEGDGLRHLVKEKCDALIKLPTAGAISSLNVSNAAAVALYAAGAGGASSGA